MRKKSRSKYLGQCLCQAGRGKKEKPTIRGVDRWGEFPPPPPCGGKVKKLALKMVVKISGENFIA